METPLKVRIIAAIALVMILVPVVGSFFNVNVLGFGKPAAATIGLIDVQRIFDESDKGKLEKAAFDAKTADATQTVRALAEQGQALQQQIQGALAVGNYRLVNRLGPRLQAIQRKYKAAESQAMTELQKAQADVDKSFMEQIKQVADQLRQDSGVDLVMVADKNKILSFHERVDLTEKAIAIYNHKFPAVTPPAATDEKANVPEASSASGQPSVTELMQKK